MNTVPSPAFKSLIDQLVEQRDQALSQLKPGKSLIVIVMRKGGIRFYCIYKGHDKSSITVETTKEQMDHLFHNKTLVLFGGPTTPVDQKFSFLDVEICKA